MPFHFLNHFINKDQTFLNVCEINISKVVRDKTGLGISGGLSRKTTVVLLSLPLLSLPPIGSTGILGCTSSPPAGSSGAVTSGVGSICGSMTSSLGGVWGISDVVVSGPVVTILSSFFFGVNQPKTLV